MAVFVTERERTSSDVSCLQLLLTISVKSAHRLRRMINKAASSSNNSLHRSKDVRGAKRADSATLLTLFTASARSAVPNIDEQHLHHHQQNARTLDAQRAKVELERPLSAVSDATRTAEIAVPAKASLVLLAPAAPSPHALPTGAAAMQRDLPVSKVHKSGHTSPEATKRTTRAAAFQVERNVKRPVRPVTAPAVSESQALPFAHARQISITPDGDVEADARFASRIGANGLQVYDEPKSFRNDTVGSDILQTIRCESRVSISSGSTLVNPASTASAVFPSASSAHASRPSSAVPDPPRPVRKRANTNAAPINVESAFSDMLVSDTAW